MVLNTELLNVPQGNNAVYTVACYPVTKRNRAGKGGRTDEAKNPETIGLSLATVVLPSDRLGGGEVKASRRTPLRKTPLPQVGEGLLRKERRVNG